MQYAIYNEPGGDLHLSKFPEEPFTQCYPNSLILPQPAPQWAVLRAKATTGRKKHTAAANTSAWWGPPKWVSHQGKAEWWDSCRVSIPKKQQWLARISLAALNWSKVCISRVNYLSPGHLWYQGSFPLWLMPVLQLQSMEWGNGQDEIDSCSKHIFLVCCFFCFVFFLKKTMQIKLNICFPAWLHTLDIGDARTSWKLLFWEGQSNSDQDCVQ